VGRRSPALDGCKRFNRPEFEMFNYGRLRVFSATAADGRGASEAASLAGHLKLANVLESTTATGSRSKAKTDLAVQRKTWGCDFRRNGWKRPPR